MILLSVSEAHIAGIETVKCGEWIGMSVEVPNHVLESGEKIEVTLFAISSKGRPRFIPNGVLEMPNEMYASRVYEKLSTLDVDPYSVRLRFNRAL